MGHRIDHLTTAEDANRLAMRHRGFRRIAWHLKALVHSMLALVAAQDRANELKRIEILVALSYGGGYGDPDVSSTFAEAAAWKALHEDSPGHPLVPSIARSLGLGGESDGE